jgi:hypothetical protein
MPPIILRDAWIRTQSTAGASILHILKNNVLRVFFNIIFLFSGQEPIYFIENKEKTLRARASYDRGTQIFDYMV